MFKTPFDKVIIHPRWEHVRYDDEPYFISKRQWSDYFSFDVADSLADLVLRAFNHLLRYGDLGIPVDHAFVRALLQELSRPQCCEDHPVMWVLELEDTEDLDSISYTDYKCGPHGPGSPKAGRTPKCDGHKVLSQRRVVRQSPRYLKRQVITELINVFSSGVLITASQIVIDLICGERYQTNIFHQRPVDRYRELPVESLVDASKADIAFNADASIDGELKKPKKRRGGRRAAEKKACYLKAFRKRDRLDAYHFLGRAPYIQTLCDYASDKMCRVDGLFLVLVGDRKMHMIYRNGANLKPQMNYLLQNHPGRRVGATLEQFEEIELEQFTSEERKLAAQICEIPHFFDDFTGAQGSEPMPEDYAEDLDGARTPEWTDQTDIAQECADAEGPFDCTLDQNYADLGFIKGSGSCWRKLPQLVGLMHGFEVTIYDVWSYYSSLEEKPDVIIDWCVQEDGDLHIIKVYDMDISNSARGDSSFVEDTAVNEMMRKRFRSIQQKKLSVPPEPGVNRHNFQNFVDALDAHLNSFADQEEEPLIGYESKSAFDEAKAKVYSPDVVSALDRQIAVGLTEDLNEIRKYCPWRIPVVNQHHMSELKIPWTATETTEHPHPIHAAVRRMAYEELAKHINIDCTVISAKRPHFERICKELKNAGKGHLRMELVNPIITYKDISRWGTDESVPEPVFGIPKIDTPMVWIDEAGHNLQPAFLINLKASNPGVQVIGYSTIFPMMALTFPNSPCPDLFDWRIVENIQGKKDMIYVPEGDDEGRYVQQFDPTMVLLKRCESDKGDIAFTGGTLWKKMNLRIHMYYAYDIMADDFLVEHCDDYMPIPRLISGMPKDLAPVSRENWRKLFEYLIILPKCDEKIARGKLRQFMEDEHVYLPEGDKDWLVLSVLEAVKHRATFDGGTKFYDSLGGKIKYNTISRLVAMYRKVTVAKYANRWRSLINQEDPMRVWPTLDVVCKKVSDNSYQISWKPRIKTGIGGLWRKMCRWLAAMGHDMSAETVVEIDVDGSLIFPFVQNTYYMHQFFSASFIAESQRQDFLKVFQARKDGRPIHNSEYNEVSKFKLKAIEPEIKIDPPRPPELPKWKPLPETPPDESSSDTDTDSVSSEDTDITEPEPPERVPVVERTVGPASENNAFDHCEDCPNYFEVLTACGATPDDYMKICARRHSIEKLPEGVIKDNLRRWFHKCYVEVTPDDILADVQVLSERQIKEQREKEAMNAVPIRADPIFEVKTLPDQDVDEKKAELEAMVRWNKIRKAKPKVKPRSSQYQGGLLWDAIFPTSVDNRVMEVPYRDVREWCDIEYPKNDCVLKALAMALGKSREEVLFVMTKAYPGHSVLIPDFIPLDALHPVGCHWNVRIMVYNPNGTEHSVYGVKRSTLQVNLVYDGTHMSFKGRSGKVVVIRKPVQRHIPKTNFLDTLNDWPALNIEKWVPEPKRAGNYVRALVAGTTGLMGHPLNQDRLKEWMAVCDTPTVHERNFAIVAGHPGCRKSSHVQKLLLRPEYRKERIFNYVLPTSVLAQDVRDKLDATTKDAKTGKALPGNCVTTFESTLAKGLGAETMILDENKFPKGYIALMCLLNPDIRNVIFLCDPWQTSWHEPNPDCLLNDNSLPGEAEFYVKYMRQYLIGSWRLGIEGCNFWRMPSFGTRDTQWAFMDFMPTKYEDLKPHFPWMSDATLVDLWTRRFEFYAAHVDVMWAEQLRKAEFASFAGSQGLTCPLFIVEVDLKVAKIDDPRMLFTVTTRGQYIIFVKRWTNNGGENNEIESNPVLRVLEHYRYNYTPGKRFKVVKEWSLSIHDITYPIPSGVKTVLCGPPEKLLNWEFVKDFWPADQLEHYIDPDKSRAGVRLHYDDEVYKDHPEFWPFISELEEPKVFEPGIPEPLLPEAKMPTVLPLAIRGDFEEYHNAQVLERFDTELVQRREYSEQRIDYPVIARDAYVQLRRDINKWISLGLPRRKAVKASLPLKTYMPKLTLWADIQKSSDQVAFLAAYKQRIKWSTIDDNWAQYRQHEAFGNKCWESYKKYLNWHERPKWNSILYEQCIAAFQERRADRSEELKKASLNRAFQDDDIILTAKSQMKLKSREYKVSAPLQPVMIHGDKPLFEQGPLAAYMLRMLKDNCPGYFFYSAEENEDSFQSWVSRNVSKAKMFEMNDQKGQDTSVQSWAVHIIRNMMEWFNVPKPMIENFVKFKMTGKINGKVLSPMTRSGEPWTHFINTNSSAARECFKFNLPPGLPMGAGGDDIFRLVAGDVSSAYKPFESLDPTIDKRYRSPRGDFTSFIIKDGFLVKDPIILLKRFLVKIEMGAAEDAVDGYHLLWARNYNLSDDLFSIFDEEEMDAHQILTRIFFNLKKEGLFTKVDWSRLKSERLVGVNEQFASTEQAQDPGFRDLILKSDSLDEVRYSLPDLTFWA
jgi:hypothetical protein